MSIKQTFLAALLGISSLLGCNQKDSGSQSNSDSHSTIAMDMAPPATVEIHLHPTEGPHHGLLIELGKEEFHAELIHDDKSVTIYILDSSATKAVPIDSKELAINLVHDGKPEQFRLLANPDTDDPTGKASRFILENQELVSHIDDESTTPKLSVTIDGKAYRGVISHDHSGHNHAGHKH